VAVMKPMVEYGAEFGKLDPELISLLPKSLKVIAAAGAGFDWADHEELGRQGMKLVSVVDVRDLVYQWSRSSGRSYLRYSIVPDHRRFPSHWDG
jgi:hypothetical protein